MAIDDPVPFRGCSTRGTTLRWCNLVLDATAFHYSASTHSIPSRHQLPTESIGFALSSLQQTVSRLETILICVGIRFRAYVRERAWVWVWVWRVRARRTSEKEDDNEGEVGIDASIDMVKPGAGLYTPCLNHSW